MKIDAGSDIGRVRETNQDYVNYIVLGENEFFCVLCDGMGGHRAGEVASSLCGEDLIKSFPKHPPFFTDADIKAYFVEILEHANHIIKHEANGNQAYDGMGTTAVIAYVVDENIYISHVGDSRAYIFCNHQLIQITEDDTLVNDLVKKGYLTANQAKNHPKKNILSQAVGVTTPLNISFHKYIYPLIRSLLVTGRADAYSSIWKSRLTRSSRHANIIKKLIIHLHHGLFHTKIGTLQLAECRAYTSQSLEYVRPYCSYSNMIQIIFHTICAPACAIMEY